MILLTICCWLSVGCVYLDGFFIILCTNVRRHRRTKKQRKPLRTRRSDVFFWGDCFYGKCHTSHNAQDEKKHEITEEDLKKKLLSVTVSVCLLLIASFSTSDPGAYSCGWKKARSQKADKRQGGLARRAEVLQQLCEEGVKVALEFRDSERSR